MLDAAASTGNVIAQGGRVSKVINMLVNKLVIKIIDYMMYKLFNKLDNKTMSMFINNINYKNNNIKISIRI